MDLKAIRGRAEKATPGPWDVSTCRRCDMLHLRDGDCQDIPDPTEDDRQFLSHAREDIPALLERVRQLEEALRFQDPRNAAERYDKIADDFERETGLWPPGRSRAAAMGPDPHQEETHIAWRKFVNEWHEKFFDRALSTEEEGE